MEPTHAIVLRRYDEDTDCDKFSILKTTPGVLEAMNEVCKITGNPEDIYYICDIAAVSDVTNRYDSLYVVGYNGTLPMIATKRWRDPGIGLDLSLPQLWEGNRASVSDMVWCAGYFGVPKDVLFMTVVECLEFAIKEVGLNSIKQEAFHAYSSLTRYMSEEIDAIRFKKLVDDYDRHIATVDYISMNYAILHCSLMAFGRHLPSNAYDAMTNIADVLYHKGEHDLIAILRSRIPLRKLLIASLGV